MEQEARLAAASISIVPVKAEGFGEKFERFVRGYKKRPVAIEESFRGDPMVVLSNVRRGMSALRPKLPALRSDPTVNWDEMEAAEDVAEALVYACGFVVDDKVTREQIEQVRRNLQKLREPGLLIARGLALLDYLPIERVEAIEEGKGLLDTGRDGLALPALLREYAPKIEGMHPFTEQRLRTMESLGAWILRNVTPDGAVAVKPSEPDQATRDRDMIWNDLRKRHASMRLAGFKLYGEAFNDYVPPLGSRVVTRSSDGEDAPVDPPAPSPAPAPARPA